MRIAFLGDSLTEGSPGASFFRLLRRRSRRHELLNHGRGGDSVADLYHRLQAGGVESFDLAVIWIGTNDAAMGPWTSWAMEAFEPVTWEATLDQLAVIYRRLLALALERAPQALCLPPVVADELDEDWARRVADVGEVVTAAVAAEPRAALLDLAPAFAARRAASETAVRFTIDGVHLSQAGAEVVADALSQAIADLSEGGLTDEGTSTMDGG